MMQAKRRSPQQQKIDVVRIIADGPIRYTPLLAAANLNWPVLKDILRDLTERGFVQEQREGKRVVTITPDGIEALRVWDQTIRLLGD